MLPAPSTDPGAVTRPTCTTTRHTAPNWCKRRCRCAIGREARRLYLKRWKTGRTQPYLVDATASRRIVQGLMMLGWSRERIAAAGGLTGRYDYELIGRTARGQKYLTVSTARAIRRAEDRLGNEEGPSQRVRTIARSLGYMPLDAWTPDTIGDPAAQPWSEEVMDEVAIQRAMRGQRVTLTHAERVRAVVLLASAPHLLTDGAIADRLHMAHSTATKLRDRAGVPRVALVRQKAAA